MTPEETRTVEISVLMPVDLKVTVTIDEFDVATIVGVERAPLQSDLTPREIMDSMDENELMRLDRLAVAAFAKGKV